MIISRTPLRISFAGGGTDLKSFYELEAGAVLSTAIDKYIYISVNKKFDHRIRLSYSKTEIVDTVNEIQHDLVRESMKLTGVTSGIEITSIADIPSRGTGLGSSSSFTVGLLNALYAYKGESASAERLAEEACHIEIEKVKEPIGKQDQYIAAYGGLQFIEFMPDDHVFVDPVICKKETKQKLHDHLLLLYTGITRKANTILTEQKSNSVSKRETLSDMRKLADKLRKVLREGKNINQVGELLHEGWNLKKQMASGISNPEINELYELALKKGASGGKILGAGGGGFLLLFCPLNKRIAVKKALSNLQETPFKLEPQGSKIIYVEE